MPVAWNNALEPVFLEIVYVFRRRLLYFILEYPPNRGHVSFMIPNRSHRLLWPFLDQTGGDRAPAPCCGNGARVCVDREGGRRADSPRRCEAKVGLHRNEDGQAHRQLQDFVAPSQQGWQRPLLQGQDHVHPAAEIRNTVLQTPNQSVTKVWG